MTYREEILEVLQELVRDRPTRQFTLAEAVTAMQARGSSCNAHTVKTYIAGVMCVDAPANHRKRYAYVERVDVGRYRLL